MNQNMPYTVPEGFFESVNSSVVERADRIRRRRLSAGFVCGGLVAALSVCLFLLPLHPASYEYQSEDEEILENYECDIFLMNFEY